MSVSGNISQGALVGWTGRGVCMNREEGRVSLGVWRGGDHSLRRWLRGVGPPGI